MMKGIFYDFQRSANDYQKCISLKKPQIVGIYQSDGSGLTSPSHLLYFKKPAPPCYPLDLNEGYGDYKFCIAGCRTPLLNNITEYLMQPVADELDDLKEKSYEENKKVYTQRGVLFDIMLAPYRLHGDTFYDNFTIKVTKFKGALYIMMCPRSMENNQVTGRRNTYHFKLRQWCFSDSPKTQPDTNAPSDENMRMFCVYRNHFDYQSQLDQGNFDILYSAETSGIISDIEIKPTNLDELNKCRFVHTKLLKSSVLQRMPWQKHPKIADWWAQALLCNVNDIYFGILDQQGYVQSPIEHVLVSELPKNQAWKPNVCIGFLHKFLTLLADKMSEVDCPHTVYKLTFLSDKSRFDYEIFEGKTEHSFLSAEFVQHMRKSD